MNIISSGIRKVKWRYDDYDENNADNGDDGGDTDINTEFNSYYDSNTLTVTNIAHKNTSKYRQN